MAGAVTASRPALHHEDAAPSVEAQPRESASLPAYRPQKWMDVLDARILLDVLTRCVHDGGEAEMSMIYPDALESFGADSKHLIAACQGQVGAGAHYQQTVAGGRYSNGE